MRVAIIIFVCVFGILSFAPNMQGGQFFKISEVIEHYQEHQSGKETFDSFLSFLKEHYSREHNTNENERHLPFKTDVASTSILVIQDIKIHPVLSLSLIPENQNHCFGEQKGKIQDKSIPVWNPPKIC